MNDFAKLRHREDYGDSVLVRYVELHILADKLDEARRLLKFQAPLVRNFDGCVHLEINEAMDEIGVFSTYSYWIDAEALDRYRQSEVFRKFWNRMKPMFQAKAQARSFMHLVAPM